MIFSCRERCDLDIRSTISWSGIRCRAEIITSTYKWQVTRKLRGSIQHVVPIEPTARADELITGSIAGRNKRRGKATTPRSKISVWTTIAITGIDTDVLRSV
eukprot:IDg16870t1